MENDLKNNQLINELCYMIESILSGTIVGLSNTFTPDIVQRAVVGVLHADEFWNELKKDSPVVDEDYVAKLNDRFKRAFSND